MVDLLQRYDNRAPHVHRAERQDAVEVFVQQVVAKKGVRALLGGLQLVLYGVLRARIIEKSDLIGCTVLRELMRLDLIDMVTLSLSLYLSLSLARSVSASKLQSTLDAVDEEVGFGLHSLFV